MTHDFTLGLGFDFSTSDMELSESLSLEEPVHCEQQKKT